MDEMNLATPLLMQKHDYIKQDFIEILEKIFDYFKIDIISLDKNPNFINKMINPLSFYKNFSSGKIPIINLNKISWNDYYETVSNAKTRQTDRRKEKLLLQRGELRFIIADSISDREKIFDFTIKNKVLFLKKRGLDYQKFQKIYLKLFNQIKKNPKYVCSMLKLDNQIISSIVSRLDDDYFYYLVPCTIENDFLKYSPGRLLLKKQIEWCVANNINKIDLGPGEFKYKKQWSNKIERNFKILEPKSFLGNIFFILYKLKNFFN